MRALAALALVLAALVAASSATAGGRPAPQLVAAAGLQPVLRHPNPLFTSTVLDYVNPIPAPGGGVAWLTAPRMDVIPASVRDLLYLEYEQVGDLGGFMPAPLHMLALTGAVGKYAAGGLSPPGQGLGRVVFGKHSKLSEVPLFRHQASGKVNSYTFLHGTTAFGGQFGNGSRGVTLPQVGPTPPPPGSATHIPRRNRCFGGCPKPPKKRPRPPRHRPGPPGRGDCGTAGISIVSNLAHCRIYVVNQAPGDGTFEQMTIKNTTSTRYVLSLQARGTPNVLWNDLQMGVWERGTPAPEPLPPLQFWTAQFNPIVTLAPKQVIHLTIELYLPIFAGNENQKRTAVIDFVWHAQGTP